MREASSDNGCRKVSTLPPLPARGFLHSAGFLQRAPAPEGARGGKLLRRAEKLPQPTQFGFDSVLPGPNCAGTAPPRAPRAPLCGAQAPRMVPLCVGQTKLPQRKSDVDSGHSVLPVNSAGQAHPHPGCDARSGLQGRHEVFTLPPR